MNITRYGPGDDETWGPCAGHPSDPRTEEDMTEEQAKAVAIEAAEDAFIAAISDGDQTKTLPTTVGEVHITTLLTWIETPAAIPLLKASSSAWNGRHEGLGSKLRSFVLEAMKQYASDNWECYL